MVTGKKLVISAVVLALVQIGFLSWIIAGRAAILRNGTEVLLKVEPVDPRDLLRGDYVRLGYEISTIPAKLVADLEAGRTKAPVERILVRLKKDADGYWRPVSVFFSTPPSAPGVDQADIAGSIPPGYIPADHSFEPDATLSPDYGIERFYLPEGEGRAIETDMRVRPFGVRVALAKDGTPQIKALVDGDETLFEEPLY
ncbi:GDYXXLXY domain-containing protein [Mesorhizobium amorphae]